MQIRLLVAVFIGLPLSAMAQIDFTNLKNGATEYNPLIPISLTIPNAAAGVTPTTCNAGAKGRLALTNAGDPCFCNGTAWEDEGSIDILTGLLKACTF